QTIWRTGYRGVEGESVPPGLPGVMFAVEAATSTRAHNTGGTDMPDGIRWVGLDARARVDAGDLRSGLWRSDHEASGRPSARAAARSRPLPRGHPRGPGPCAAPDRELPIAPRDLLGGHRRGVDTQAPLVADLDQVRRPRVAVDAGRLPARPRRTDRPTRSGR